jgi:sulfite reductase alpha subunit-like flavoprotein
MLSIDDQKVFTVEVEKTKNVSILKKLIKEEKAPHLNHVATSDLNLWNVSIPMDDDAGERLENIDNLEPLKPLLSLLQVFPHVEENHLHVVVRSPIDGELFEIF